MILAAARITNQRIAEQAGMHVDTVRKWRSQFAEHGIDGLQGLPRPRLFAPTAVPEARPRSALFPHTRQEDS